MDNMAETPIKDESADPPGETADPVVSDSKLRQPDPLGDGLEAYDFRRPARVSKDRKRSLEAIYGLFVKTFEGWLAGRTRAPIQMNLAALEQLTYGEFQMSLRAPCAAYSFGVTQCPSQNCVIAMGSDFSYYLLDRLLGGPGHGVGMHDRALTVMERQVLKIVAAKAATQLSEVWQEYAELEFTEAGFESIPDMLRAASREEPYLIADMSVIAGEVECSITVALPFAGLDGFFTSDLRQPNSAEQTSPARVADRRSAEGTVRSAALEVSVRLPSFSMPLSEVIDLKPGQLMTTPHFGATPVQIVVGDQTRFLGRPGRRGTRLAAEITEVLDEDPEKDRNPRITQTER